MTESAEKQAQDIEETCRCAEPGEILEGYCQECGYKVGKGPFALALDGLARDAERYRWLRNPTTDVALVLDKVAGEVPADELGGGGYRIYEYRAGEDLDSAIDAAMSASKEGN
jgi:hypothetical protein